MEIPPNTRYHVHMYRIPEGRDQMKRGEGYKGKGGGVDPSLQVPLLRSCNAPLADVQCSHTTLRHCCNMSGGPMFMVSLAGLNSFQYGRSMHNSVG